MRLPNPNTNKPYDRVIKDVNGEPVYGVRQEHSPDEEIVHIPTGQSNQQYWQPEVVMNPEGCDHHFFLYDAGNREVECDKCHFATSFIVGVNFTETPKGAFITLKKRDYPISL